ncbi:hypothetical protein P153DRAFT_213241 [Dothidotthia symphoricarpi CBS 119687]|uniref:Uncharacterized protein n=1 Tax=Dothidotthia symphoricarpi CBS 119687 TaxID=1392245 RepID=A0A6A6AI34_9PLEO|nr:uncharacterized protein P153DRAFT_213241 [Dothidotthia symphoricarpi CBS 119687]KAF2131216.1 hypothetical protein P153DRAFT_213241 [Dothidotthia symphoricarpi CBS 119687]
MILSCQLSQVHIRKFQVLLSALGSDIYTSCRSYYIRSCITTPALNDIGTRVPFSAVVATSCNPIINTALTPINTAEITSESNMNGTERLLFVFLILSVHGLSIPSEKIRLDLSQTPKKASNAWSTEAILTLIGICTATGCFAIGLAWPKLRRWVCRPYHCKSLQSCASTTRSDLTDDF